MTKPIKPETLPIWCSEPIKEKYSFTDSAGSAKVAEELNIDAIDLSEIKRGLTSDKPLTLQDYNYVLNWIFRKLEYIEYNNNILISYTKDSLPSAADNINLVVYVSDQTCLAMSDGTNWKKITIGNNV